MCNILKPTPLPDVLVAFLLYIQAINAMLFKKVVRYEPNDASLHARPEWTDDRVGGKIELHSDDSIEEALEGGCL